VFWLHPRSHVGYDGSFLILPHQISHAQSLAPALASAVAATAGHWLLFSSNLIREVTVLLSASLRRSLVPATLLFSAVLSAQTLAHTTGIVHTEPVDIAYETFGAQSAALPVIAVNGGPGLTHAYMIMNDMWQQVARHRLVVFYDQRGTGSSKRLAPGAPQTMDAQVADLDAVRAHLGLDQVALVGDSFGGWIVMAYTAAHPEHVAKLVLSDSPGPTWKATTHLLPEAFPDVEAEGAAAEKQLGETDAAARAGLNNHFLMMFWSTEHRDAYLAKAGANLDKLGYEPAVGQAMSEGVGTSDFTADLPKFRCPTLVVNGRFDMNVGPLTAWTLAHAIPGAKLVFFEESGHLPSYEEPEKYRTVLEEFLNSH
jgi:proline iminopeptidase